MLFGCSWRIVDFVLIGFVDCKLYLTDWPGIEELRTDSKISVKGELVQ